MAHKPIKRFSTPLIAREIQIKTTMKYHFIPARMAIIIIITELENNKYW